MYLNWDSAIHFHPTSLAPALRGIPVPTYGNYGGPGHSGPGEPVDLLDAAFQVHDQASAAALTPGDQSAADAVLIGQIQFLDTTGQLEDPEASLTLVSLPSRSWVKWRPMMASACSEGLRRSGP